MGRLNKSDIELLARITAKDLRSLAYAVQHGTIGDEARLDRALMSMRRALDLIEGATRMNFADDEDLHPG